jgi:hypothetical protein
MLPAKSLAQIVRLLVFVGWDQRASRAPAHHGSVLKLVGRRVAGPTLQEHLQVPIPQSALLFSRDRRVLASEVFRRWETVACPHPEQSMDIYPHWPLTT